MFSAPEVVARMFWRKKECLSAPEVIPGGKWCTNGAFPTPETGVRTVWCANGAFSAQKATFWGKWWAGGAFVVPGSIFVNFAFCMLGLVKEYKRKKAFAAALKMREGRAMQQPQFPVYGEMGPVGFLCELERGGDPQMVADIVASLRKAGKPFRGMVLETGSAFKDNAAREDFAHICHNYNVVFVDYRKFNAAGIPNEQDFSGMDDVKAFYQMQYDMFLNLNNSGSFTLDLLALGIDTKCLVGMANNPRMPYTMVMEPSKEVMEQSGKGFSFSRYIDALFNYMKTINAKQAQ